jgi:hypothetical protein
MQMRECEEVELIEIEKNKDQRQNSYNLVLVSLLIILQQVALQVGLSREFYKNSPILHTFRLHSCKAANRGVYWTVDLMYLHTFHKDLRI